MIGFSFKGIHSSNFKIGVKSSDRSLIPALRKNEFVIPGRQGTLDTGFKTYDKRPIKMILGLIDNDSWEELRLSARDVAYWLSGQGRLIFDDEPDKVYNASLTEYVGIEQIHLLPIAGVSITFDCQPLAESLYYNQQYLPENTQKTRSIQTKVKGTSDSCCIITIKNIGTTNISNIILTRKAEI